MKVFDVRDYSDKKNGVFVVGGFVGELIVTLTALCDYILANPANQGFIMTFEDIQKFMVDFIVSEE